MLLWLKNAGSISSTNLSLSRTANAVPSSTQSTAGLLTSELSMSHSLRINVALFEVLSSGGGASRIFFFLRSTPTTSLRWKAFRFVVEFTSLPSFKQTADHGGNKGWSVPDNISGCWKSWSGELIRAFDAAHTNNSGVRFCFENTTACVGQSQGKSNLARTHFRIPFTGSTKLVGVHADEQQHAILKNCSDMGMLMK